MSLAISSVLLCIIQSIMGMVMRVGIVVNNAIVLVDYLNLKRREDGLDVRAAAIVAGRTRLRPILMTTSTTVLGLLPLALGWGKGAGSRPRSLGSSSADSPHPRWSRCS